MTQTNDELINKTLSHTYLVDKLKTVDDNISDDTYNKFTNNIADDIINDKDIALKRSDLIAMLKSKLWYFWSNYIKSYLYIHRK